MKTSRTLEGIQALYKDVGRRAEGVRYGDADPQMTGNRDALLSRAEDVRKRLAAILGKEARRMFGAAPELDGGRTTERAGLLELPCSGRDLENFETVVGRAEEITRLLELSRRIRIRTNPMYRNLHTNAAPLIPGSQEMRRRIRETDERAAELSPVYREMMELFGDNFLMIGAVDEAFTLRDGTKLTDMPSRAQQITEILEEFLKEPGIKEFIEKLKAGEMPGGVPKNGWYLRLDVPLMDIGEDHPLYIEGENPYQFVRLKTLQQFLEPDMVQRGRGLLFEPDNSAYEREVFFSNDGFVIRVVIGTNEPIPGSEGKTLSEQEMGKTLEDFGEKTGLRDRLWSGLCNCSSPISIAYRHVLAVRTTGKGILEGKAERAVLIEKFCNHRIIVNPPIFMGCLGSEGLGIYRATEKDGIGQRAGLSFSRRSQSPGI